MPFATSTVLAAGFVALLVVSSAFALLAVFTAGAGFGADEGAAFWAGAGAIFFAVMQFLGW